jgi:hypothetical protein
MASLGKFTTHTDSMFFLFSNNTRQLLHAGFYYFYILKGRNHCMPLEFYSYCNCLRIKIF